MNKKKFLILMMFILAAANGNAQWINNSSENTKLVVNAADPINISTVKDSRGGAFIFWQDYKNSMQSEVLFMHVDNNGKLSFREDGKRVCNLAGMEEEPLSVQAAPNSAVVVWKDFSLSHFGNLYAQRVASNGKFIWQQDGIEVTKTENEIGDFSICSNKSGNVFAAYVVKPSEITGEYKLEIQKISPSGKALFEHNRIVYSSIERKGSISVIDDEDGGAYLLWLEYKNNKSFLVAQHIDSLGRPTWGKRPLEISGNINNVTLYSAVKIKSPAIYVAWQTQKATKDIYHQIITDKGKNLWASGGKLATPRRGNQVNPVAAASDSSAILSWTEDNGKNKDIYIQKFYKNSRPAWGRMEIPVIKYKGGQFGQKIISDGKGGAIVAWIDGRNDSAYADIYAQRIDERGKAVWDSLGVPVCSNYNTLKSYLSLLPDESGGAIAIFKNKRNGKNDLYGQRIFSSGTYVSQILGLTTELINDSIKISWYTANEKQNTKYIVERTTQTGNDSITWTPVGTLYSSQGGVTVHYRLFDIPNVTGTLFYRIIQSDAAGNIQTSDLSGINYFGASSSVIVAQNSPNPFSDSTKITIYLPYPADVTVEIFDGHVVKINEIDKSLPAGENKINFSAKGLKPGVYFYRVKVNDFVDVKKMIITN